MSEWGNGCTQPNIADITTESLVYWVQRSHEANNPLLKMRYADVTWDFSQWLNHKVVRGKIATILIDSVLTLAVQNAFPNEIEGYQGLKRALDIGMSIRDSGRVHTLRSGLIAYEDRHAKDCLPGTWGICFDLLINENQKMKVTPQQATKIIADLEARLTRLSAQEDVAKLDPHHVEGAALRLATHYRKMNWRDDLRRVMELYAGTFMRKAETNPWVGSAWLDTVHRKLIEFQLHDEAKKFQPTLRVASVKMRRAMPKHTYSVPVNTADLNACINFMIQGEWNVVFCRLIDAFLPCRERELEKLQETMKNRPALDLFTPTKVDHAGRVIAKIGTMSRDPEGNLMHHYSKLIEFAESFLRWIMEALIAERGMSADQIVCHIYQSPVPDPSRRAIVQCAMEAYIAKNWVVAIHLLIPQIEDTIRRLVDLSGGVTWREGKHEGMHVRNLDELLNDENVVTALGDDTAFYFRSLLTDQRGWNVRNDVAHGLVPPESFSSVIADRLVHAMLIFGSLQPKSQQTEGDVTPVEQSEHERSMPDSSGIDSA